LIEASAVIVAAGISTRLNGVDKNFFKISGKYIVEYSIEIFESINEIKEIILVLNDSNVIYGEALKSKYRKLKLTKGGDLRAQSVENGVNIANYEYVLVHDGARPFIKKRAC